MIRLFEDLAHFARASIRVIAMENIDGSRKSNRTSTN